MDSTHNIVINNVDLLIWKCDISLIIMAGGCLWQAFSYLFFSNFFHDEDEDDVNHGYILCSDCIPRKYECWSWSDESNEEI